MYCLSAFGRATKSSQSLEQIEEDSCHLWRRHIGRRITSCVHGKRIDFTTTHDSSYTYPMRLQSTASPPLSARTAEQHDSWLAMAQEESLPISDVVYTGMIQHATTEI